MSLRTEGFWVDTVLTCVNPIPFYVILSSYSNR